MSGFAGIWNLDGRPVEPNVLARMSATLRHRGPDGEDCWIGGEAALAFQHSRVTPEAAHERQPLVGGGHAIVFDGRLDNREELLGLLPRRLSRETPDPELVLAVWRELGVAAVARMTGDFALAIHDGVTRSLLLATDAIGMRPLYYHRSGDLLLFASEIKALLAHPGVAAVPDDDTLAWLLLSDPAFARPGATCFRGIHGVPPAHLLEVTPARAVLRRYWDFDPAVARRTVSGHVEGFRHFFGQAVERRLRSVHPVAVSVSGGLDSSAVFCWADRVDAKAPVIGLTYETRPGTPEHEGEYLEAVESRARGPIHRIPLRPEIDPNLASVAWHAEAPFVDAFGNTHRRLRATAGEKGARVLMTGMFGDHLLFDRAYLVDLARRFRWLAVAAHLSELPRWSEDVEQGYYRRQFVRDLVRYQLPEPVIDQLRRARRLLPARGIDRTRAFAMDWFPAEFRTRRAPRQGRLRAPRFRAISTRNLYSRIRAPHSVLSLEIQNKLDAAFGLDSANPFLDRDLVAFVLGVPPEVRAHGGIPKYLLREALASVLPEEVRNRRTKADFTNAGNRSLAAALPHIVERVRDGLAARAGYVNVTPESAKSLSPEAWGNDATASFFFADLLGFETWLQAFIRHG